MTMTAQLCVAVQMVDLVLWHVNSVMYSCRLGLPSCLLGRQALEELGEIGAGELPLERPRPDLVVGLEGEDLSSKVIEGGRVRRREDFALEDREVNFHLIQPAGVEGQVHGHQVLVSFLQASDSSHRGTAAVEHPEDAASGAIR